MKDRGRQIIAQLQGERGAHSTHLYDNDPSVVALRRFIARLDEGGTGLSPALDLKNAEARSEAEDELRRIRDKYFVTD